MKKILTILKNRKWTAAFITAAALVLLLRPSDKSGGNDDYFVSLGIEMRKARMGRPTILIDMDRLDWNIRKIQEATGDRLRLVEKSLPSIELITYLMKKTACRKIMVFHAPFTRELLRRIPGPIDLLPGKPFPVSEVRSLIASLTPAEKNRIRSVQWLVDDDSRLKEYFALARELRTRLRINLEIDIGLHRGGAESPEQFNSLLKFIKEHPAELEFSGVMGYDGHVPHVPSLSFYHERAVRNQFDQCMKRYRDMVDAGKKAYPEMFHNRLTFNGGGSRTYSLYGKESPVNDISIGSAFLFPAAFEDFTLTDHRAAVFIAAPVLKRFERFWMPFQEIVPGFASVVKLWDPNARYSYYLYGGGWPAHIVYPSSLEINTLTASTPNENLLPNQSLYHSSSNEKLAIGDFVFFRPMQSDAIMQFEEIQLIRSGRPDKIWKTFPRRL